MLPLTCNFFCRPLQQSSSILTFPNAQFLIAPKNSRAPYFSFRCVSKFVCHGISLDDIADVLHNKAAVATATSLALERGFSDAIFGLAVVYGSLIMYDAQIITDDDLIALVSDEVFQPQVIWKLEDVQVTCGTLGLSTATVKLTDASGSEYVACSVGTGPVDAAYKAVDLIVKEQVKQADKKLALITWSAMDDASDKRGAKTKQIGKKNKRQTNNIADVSIFFL